MPAFLYIWPNRWGPAAIGTPGHAALQVQHHARQIYISWWPNRDEKGKPFNTRQATPQTLDEDLYFEMGADTRRNLQNGTYQPRNGQTQMNLTVQGTQRPNAWAQMPLPPITILGKDDPGSDGVGLNLERICDWWQVFRVAPNAGYRFVSQTMNCASVVGTALIAGGATVFSSQSLNDLSHGWHTPNDVRNFVNEINRGIERVSAFVRHFRQPVSTLPLATRRPMLALDWERTMTFNRYVRRDLMTFESWVALSDQNVKTFLGFARRKEQVAKIDNLLREYHGLAWSSLGAAGGPGSEVWVTKCELLQKMLEQVHEHMREKPQSDRAEAVFMLGKQLVDVIDRT